MTNKGVYDGVLGITPTAQNLIRSYTPPHAIQGIDVRKMVRSVGYHPVFVQILSMERRPCSLRPDNMLWRSVILHTLYGVQNGCQLSYNWFVSRAHFDDLLEVCELADINIDYVICLAVGVRRKDFKVPTWRKIRNIWRGEPEKDRKKRK